MDGILEALRGVARAAVTRPRVALGLMLAVTVVGAAGLPSLELRTDGHALVPTDDPVAAFDTSLREAFGLRDPILVYIETKHRDDIYNVDTMRRVRELKG